MRIRKNAKLTPSVVWSSAASPSSRNSPDELLQAHVCSTNRSPWDVSSSPAGNLYSNQPVSSDQVHVHPANLHRPSPQGTGQEQGENMVPSSIQGLLIHNNDNALQFPTFEDIFEMGKRRRLNSAIVNQASGCSSNGQGQSQQTEGTPCNRMESTYNEQDAVDSTDTEAKQFQIKQEEEESECDCNYPECRDNEQDDIDSADNETEQSQDEQQEEGTQFNHPKSRDNEHDDIDSPDTETEQCQDEQQEEGTECARSESRDNEQDIDSADTETKESEIEQQEETQSDKRTRGATVMSDVWELEANKRIKVQLNSYGVPVGLEGATLTRFLGTVSRSSFYVPLNYEDWRKIPQKNKDDMWELVQTKFIFAQQATTHTGVTSSMVFIELEGFSLEEQLLDAQLDS